MTNYGLKAYFSSVIAAATKNNDDSEDDDPSAVIVEKMAKTVVVHSMFLRRMFAMLDRTLISYAAMGKVVTEEDAARINPTR